MKVEYSGDKLNDIMIAWDSWEKRRTAVVWKPYSCCFALERRKGETMKQAIYTVVGMIGSAIASVFGGWDASIKTLIIFMAIDYVSGLIVAGVFKNSSKTASGGLESKTGWKGLCRKCMMKLSWRKISSAKFLPSLSFPNVLWSESSPGEASVSV